MYVLIAKNVNNFVQNTILFFFFFVCYHMCVPYIGFMEGGVNKDLLPVVIHTACSADVWGL